MGHHVDEFDKGNILVVVIYVDVPYVQLPGVHYCHAKDDGEDLKVPIVGDPVYLEA